MKAGEGAGKKAPHSLLVGRNSSTVTLEISMENPQKTKNKQTKPKNHMTQLCHFLTCAKRLRNLVHRYLLSNVHCVLVTLTRKWEKKSKYPSTDDCIVKSWYLIHNEILSRAKEILWKVDGLGKDYTKWGHPDAERQREHTLSHLWLLAPNCQMWVYAWNNQR